MVFTKEEALKLLGVTEDSSMYMVQRRYKKLAHRYYPERNHHRKEYALKKFQKVVEAYVRIQLDPDDCDQMRIKRILMEIYSFHDDIASDKNDDLYSEDSEDDLEGVPDHVYPSSSSSSVCAAPSPFDSTNGPYSSLLQDFTLRSYMSGGRKAKSFLNMAPKKKSYISEEARKRASEHADELLKDVEEERRKEEQRKQRNKKKKEAKKRKKDKVVKEDSSEPQNEKQTNDMKIKDGCHLPRQRKPSGGQSTEGEESCNDDEFDMESAFFSRVNSKLPGDVVLPRMDEESSEQEEEEENNEISSTPPAPADGGKVLKQQQQQSTKHTVRDVPTSNGVKEASDANPNLTKTSSSPRIISKVNKSEQQSSPQQRDHRGYQRHYYQSELPPRLQKKAAESRLQQQTNGSTTKFVKTAVSDTNPGPVSVSGGEKPVFLQPTSQKQFVKTEEETTLDKSRRLAVQGNKAAKEGQFQDAVLSFTEAIKLHSSDERYFGNRSFCYEYLDEYEKALEDADVAIKLKPDWPKGHFRRGKALVGLTQYEEAKTSFQKAIELDPEYHDAAEELKKVVSNYLKPVVSENSSRQSSVDDSPPTVLKPDTNDIERPGSAEKENCSDSDKSLEPQTNEKQKTIVTQTKANSKDHKPPQDKPQEESPKMKQSTKSKESDTVWVGNIDPARIDEELLFKTFGKCGQIVKIHILSSRFCAFIRFDKPESAAESLNKYQGFCLRGCHLIVRYPDHPLYPSKEGNQQMAMENGECYFWRTTGCYFGEECHYLHIKKNRGIDMKVKKDYFKHRYH